MAQLRITVIRRASDDAVLSTSDTPLFCDPMVGIFLEGPLETLLREVAEYAQLTDPSNVSLELVLDQRQDDRIRRRDLTSDDDLVLDAVSSSCRHSVRQIAGVV